MSFAHLARFELEGGPSAVRPEARDFRTPGGPLIVVAVDFSEGSAAAVTCGRTWGVQQSMEVRLIHVRAAMAPEPPEDARWLVWLRDLELSSSEIEVRRGVPWVELVRVAGERRAALLIAGTHGCSGFQPLRLGTTAEAVALRSPSPVMLVPDTLRKASRMFHKVQTEERS